MLTIEPSVYHKRGTDCYFPCARGKWGLAERRLVISGAEKNPQRAMKIAAEILADAQELERVRAKLVERME